MFRTMTDHDADSTAKRICLAGRESDRGKGLCETVALSFSHECQTIRQLIKRCQVAINFAVILAEEDKRLPTENQRRKQECRQLNP
jgi:transposase